MTYPKAFIFGIDGGSFNLVDLLIKNGELPNLGAVLRDAVSARTDCTWPAHTGPGWASLVAAGSPGQHGVYQFFDTQDPEYRARIVGTGDFGCSTAWDWLAAEGWTLGLINIPMSHPQRNLPGYQITWPLSNTLRYCWPPTLLAELAQARAHFKSDLAAMYRGDLGYIEQALENVEARIGSLLYLLRSRPVDLVMLVLTEADRVCHHYWHFSDELHPSYQSGAEPRLCNAIRNIYRSLDRALGRILAVLPDDCPIVIVSDHGFGPGHDSFSVHHFLGDAGLMRFRNSEKPVSQASWFFENGPTVDWDHTFVYMPVPGSYGLNINLKGRQCNGVVDEADFDPVLRDVVNLLNEVLNPRTGMRAFSRILRREEAYPGPQSSRSPDLLLVPADESLMVTGSLRGDMWTRSYQTGLHRYQGMWAYRSPRVKAGRMGRAIRLVDVIPTLLADLGVPVPEDIEGRAVEDAFSSRTHERRAMPAFAQTESSDSPELESEELIRRLGEMGYL